MGRSVNALVRLFALCVGLMGVLPLGAQSFQSSFSEVKHDRAKGPATFASGVQVDAASGAASMEIPCGPGIGERGLRFRPSLSIRMAPQLGISTTDEQFLHSTSSAGVQTWLTQTIDTLYQRGFGSSSFSPGTFDLALYGAEGKQSTYSLPGGGGGSILGTVPPGMTTAAANQLLGRFGVTGTIGTLPGTINQTPADFVQIGSSGHLVLGLRNNADEVQDWLYTSMVDTTGLQYRWPRRLLVVQGEVAYEFAYVSHRFMGQLRPYISNGDREVLDSAHYVITHIRNRFGENISFDYDADGIGYTATWSTNPTVRIRVERVAESWPTAEPRLDRVDLNLGPQVPQIRVSYLGISQPVSSYLLALGFIGVGGDLTRYGKPGSEPTLALHGQRMVTHFWGESVHSVQPVRVLQEATSEAIQFTYAAGPATSWSSTTVTPTVLSAVSFPNRSISLTWEAYSYKPNFSPNAWGSSTAVLPRRPAWAYGVKQISDAGRTTTHTRVVPQMNWVTEVPQGSYDTTETWVSRDFYTAITTPDGRVAIHRFMEPGTVNGISGEDGLRNMAYLKHVEREVRAYEPGVDWRSDLNVTSPGSSSAYRWVVKDCFSTRSLGNPTDAHGPYSVPYPTRTRTWDRDSRTFSADETTTWDSANLGWTVSNRTTAITASPDLTLKVVGPGTPLTATLGTKDLITKTLDSKIPEWLFGRVSQEVTARLEDNTGNGTTTGAPAKVSKTQDPVFNTLKSVTSGDSGSLAVVTTLTYQGDSGLGASELSRANVSSPQGLTHSGSVGVESYGYDGNGFLNSIGIKPNGSTILVTRQDQDEIGRPTAQYDAENRAQIFGWDGAGRLNRISPPGGDFPTIIAYNDADHRGVTLTRGAQAQELRYNGFGELVLERRKDPNGTWSHRIFGYDNAGRHTGETVWLPGRGEDHETQWMVSNLTQDTTQTVTEPGTTVCKKWGPINPDTGERDCLQWQTTAPTTTTTTLNAIYAGSSVAYDGRGRVIKTQDATKVATTISYPVSDGFLKVVKVGSAQITQYLHDAAGRLKRVTDAKNQLTNYAYDASNRIKTVIQSDGLGHDQTRSWNYNGLGWLESLVQPESGTTTYSNFTVMGQPQTTSYNGRVVRGTFDWMGRGLTVVSDDGTVNQGFGYDTAPAGHGKPAWSQDGSVNASFGYESTTGRLTSLTTMAAGQTFTQTFAYGDGYGNRTSGNTSHGGWTQSFHPETGMPKLLRYGTTTIADTSNWTACFDPASWMPKVITYGNGASSSFTYGADQTRLAEIAHLAGSTVLERWGYTYDDNTGNLIQALDKVAGTFDQYGYDELNRLVSAVVQSAQYGDQLQSFAYDAFGNRIQGKTERVTAWSGARGASAATVAPSAVPSTANLALNAGDAALWQRNQLPVQMTNGATTGAIYDGQGNLTQIFEKPGDTANVVTMAYDALGRVTRVTHNGKGIREDYQYRADGLRTVIDDYQWGVLQKTRLQVYNDARQLVSQYEKSPSGSLTWKRDILYLGTREAAEIDAAGMHVTQVDHLGSPRVVTGPTGQVESRQKYLPFGELLERTGTLKTAKGYTGHEQTDESGLIYMQARFYIPWVGRFSSPDPARDQHFEFTQSWNIASYVRNNPVMSTDPTGMVELPVYAQQSADGNGIGAMSTVNEEEKNKMELQKKIDATISYLSDKSDTFKKMMDKFGKERPKVVLETDAELNKLGGARLTSDGSIMLSSILVDCGRTLEGRSLEKAITHELRHAMQNKEGESGQVKLITPTSDNGAVRLRYTRQQFVDLKYQAQRDGDDYINYIKNERVDPGIKRNKYQKYASNPVEYDASYYENIVNGELNAK